jgi:cytidylate kinase
MPVVAMTREMGSVGSAIAHEVAVRLDAELLRDDIVRRAAAAYRVREAGLVGAIEETPGLLERWRRRGHRYRIYLEAAVLELALRERVVLVGRWSTLFLRGIRHAVRIRVCGSPEVRARRVMARHGLAHAEAVRRIAAYDEGVRARMRQMFDVDWTDPVLYDLVINTDAVTAPTAVHQVLDLVAAPEFQPTPDSRRQLADRALAAQVRAILKATPATRAADVDVQARDGRVFLAGVVASEAERDAALQIARETPGVGEVAGELKVFRRPVR